jgi:chorismate mutase/prephenate dehydratase
VAQVIEKIRRANPGPLKQRSVAIIWREIMSACLALEAPQRVAVLGPEGTFSEQAAIEFFGGSMARRSVLRQLRRSVSRHRRGQRPVWRGGCRKLHRRRGHALARSVLHTPPHVVGEVSLLVRHNLLRLIPSAGRHRRGAGPPAGAGAMPGWLTKHLPHAERRAGHPAMPKARAWPPPTRPGPPLPANARGSEFGLHIVAHAIQDDAYNRTRFAIICLPHTLAAPQPSGKDCTSLIVSVPNRARRRA